MLTWDEEFEKLLLSFDYTHYIIKALVILTSRLQTDYWKYKNLPSLFERLKYHPLSQNENFSFYCPFHSRRYSISLSVTSVDRWVLFRLPANVTRGRRTQRRVRRKQTLRTQTHRVRARRLNVNPLLDYEYPGSKQALLLLHKLLWAQILSHKKKHPTLKVSKGDK